MAIDLAQASGVLARTPGVLRDLLDGLPPFWLEGTEGSGSWSPFDVVGHLVHGERTDWIPRARLILESGDAVPFTPFDRFAQFRDSRGKSLDDLLREFESLRAENLRTLAGWRLQPADLHRPGRHADLGPVTLGQLLATWVAHDLGHVAQITRVMARQYRGEVGPWVAYLPILTR